MALTESNMLPLGSEAPDFNLLATTDNMVTRNDVAGPEGLVVVFMCNHCPYVIHIADTLAKISAQYMSKGMGFVGINSNDANAYPADNFSNMKLEHAKRRYPFPYLFDESQNTAKAYAAACTPDIFVFNKSLQLVYRGQFDDTRPHRISSGNYDSSQKPAHGSDLTKALDFILAGQTPPTDQIPSMGCNIKWKPGNEPS